MRLNERMRIAKVVRMIKLGDNSHQADREYWMSRTPQERLDALEEIRREYHLWKDGDAEPRLQCVFTIIKLSGK